MANQKYQAEVDLALKAPDVKNVEATLNSILSAVDKLPGKGATANKAIEELVGQIRKIKTAISETGSLNAVIGDVKALGASLKTIGTLQKGLQLFSNQDIANINKGQQAIASAAKAFEAMQRQSQIKSGTFGLDETKVSGVTRAVKSLQTELNAIQQTINSGGGKVRVNDPLYQQGLQIDRNIKNLENYRQELIKTAEMAKYEQGLIAQGNVQKAQFQARQSGNVRANDIKQTFDRTPVGQTAAVNKAQLGIDKQAQFANPNFYALQQAQQELALLNQANRIKLDGLNISRQGLGLSAEARGIDILIQAKKKEITAELVRGNGETARSVQLSKELLDLQVKLKLQKSAESRSNPELLQANNQARTEATLARVQGEGGAALLKVQIALMANYAAINLVTGAISGAVSTSVQLEAALKNVQAVTATTRTEMTGLSDKIKSLAADSRFSAVEVANAALILGQAGLSAKEVADALPSVITLATAAGTSLANAVDLVTSIVGVFDKTAGDTADVANKITAASNNSKISVEKLGLAFQYVGNTAAQTGVSFEETTAALAAMSNAGITSGSTLGTGLRHFLTEVQKPSEEFLASLRRIGLSVSDIDVKSKGLIGVITTLRQAGFVASDAIKSFDIRSASAFNGLIANPAELTKQFEALQNTKAAVAANEIQMESFESQSKRLTTSFQVLIANGLTPLQSLATKAASAFADFFQILNDHQAAFQVFLTVATAFVGIALANHVAGIATAFFTFTASTNVVSTAMKALTTVTIAQSVASVSLSGAVGTILPALRNLIASLTLSVASMGVLGTASELLTGGLRALWVAISSISLATGIGIVLAGIAAAMYLLESSTDKAKRQLDELKAAANNSKAAFDDKQKSVDLLTKKIDELIYKQTDLEGNEKSLTQTGKELESQFGNIGYQTDATSNSFTNMIGKLRTLKGEMQTLANTKLDLQINSQKELLQEQLTQLQKSTVAPDRLNRFIKTNDTLNSPDITPAQRSAIQDAVATLDASKKPGFLSDPKTSDAQLQSLLRASNALDIISKTLKTDDQKKAFKDVSKDLYAVISSAAETANQKANVQGLEAQRSGRQADQQFRNSPLFNGKTFDQALPSNINFESRVKKDNPDLVGKESDLYFATKSLIDTKLDEVAVIRKTLNDQLASGAISNDTFTAALGESRRREEELKSQGKTYYDTVKNRLTADTKSEIDALKIQAGTKGASRQSRADLLRLAGEKQSKLDLAGSFGPDERAESKAAASLRNGDLRAQRLENAGGASAGKSQAQIDAAAEAAALRMQAAAASAASKVNKISATNASTLDDVDNQIDAGIQNLIKSKQLGVEALLKEQEAKNKPGKISQEVVEANKAEVEAFKEKADENIIAYAQSAAGIYKTVAKRSARFSKADAENAAAGLEQLKNQSEDALFTVARPLAQTKIAVASGFGNAGSTLEKVQELAVVQTQINGLTDQLEYYTGYIQALQSAADDAKARLDKAKAAFENASPEEKAAKQELYGIARDNFVNRNKELRSATSAQQGVRNQLDTANVSAAGIQQSIPQEASFDNINAKIKLTVANYAQAVQDFDQVGAIGEGIKSSLGGLANQFSTLFTNIVSGSMSAKDAFRNFAAGMIKAMLDIVTQALAMAAIKALLQSFGFGMASGGLVVDRSGSGIDAAGAGFTPAKMAGGGQVTGGIQGVDSVPLMAMPGEFMLKKSAVDAIGVDAAHAINNQTASSVSNSSAPSMRSNSDMAPEVTNIWLVPAGTEPSLGPKDVVMIIADTLNQGTSTVKTLVKQIASGIA